MTVVLPPPVALPDPPGDPADLLDAVDALAGAGFALGVVEAHLQGPAAHAPGWIGADAAAAAAQVGTTSAVVATVHAAVTAAIGLLGSHAELVVSARARVAVLREQQEDGFADAERRLALLVDPAAQVSSVVDPPGARAVVDDVAAGEDDRATEHRALLAEVAADAATVGGRLAGAGTGFGGGRVGPGAAEAVTLHLTSVLPGHGDAVLLQLGWQVAAELTVPGAAVDVRAVAERHRSALADPTVAGALVVALGRGGLEQLLLEAGGGDVVLAGVLAGVFDTALRAGERVPGAAPALAGVLDPADPDGVPDQVALGMGAVLSAPGATSDLALAWLPALLAREAARGVRAVDHAPAGADPVTTAVQVLSAGHRPEQAVAALDDPGEWELLLARGWSDGGASLAELVALSAFDPAGGTVLTTVLPVVGTHLLPTGDHRLTVDPSTWDRLTPALTQVAVAHPGVLVGPLGAPTAAGSAVLLAGLTLLTADPVARTRVAGAVEGAVGPRSGSTSQEGAAVTGALVAVEDRARRLAWLLTVAHAELGLAERTGTWDLFTAWVDVVKGPAGAGLQVVRLGGAWFFDADGRLELPEDTDVPLGPEGAVQRAVALVGLQPDVPVSAAAAFATTAPLIALPEPEVHEWSLADEAPTGPDRTQAWEERWGTGGTAPR